MDYTITLEEKSELSRKLKLARKLNKYIAGLPEAPLNHQPRIAQNIEHLKNKLQIIEINELSNIITELENNIELQDKEDQARTYIEHLQGWYIRPLINHFDNVKKVQALTSSKEGVGALQQKLRFFIPELYYSPEQEIIIEQLDQFFKFKAYGKNSTQSKALEPEFYEQFEFSTQNPFPNTTLGTLGLPVISYNVTEFWERIRGGEESTLVSGLCPLSTIVDELGFVLPDEKIVRPEMGFETLAVEYEDIKEIAWPKRPIISDYITLRNIFELYSEYQLNSKVSVIIWYPNYEYYLDLSENILKNYLNSGIIQNQQIIYGLNEIKKRYFKLIEFVKSELGIDGNQKQDIQIIEVDENKFNELERYRQNMEFTFFKNIYGSWHGNEPRRKLYEQLIIKHIKPVFDGLNTLHLDNSYELWVDLLGSIIIEQNRSELSGNFGWINYPSLPSLSLSRMREFNAPNNDKLYFSEDQNQFQMQLEKLPRKYIFHIAPLLLGKNEVLTKNHDEIIEEFKIKLTILNGIY